MLEEIIGSLMRPLFGIALGSLMGALFIQFATERVCKFHPSYGISYLVCFISNAIGYVCSLALAAIAVVFSKPGIVFLVVGFSFLIGSIICGKLIKHPSSGPIGFSKGLKINLILLCIGIAIWGLIMLIAVCFLGY